MRKILRNWLAPIFLATNIVLDTWLAWGGNHAALLILAVVALGATVLMGLWASLARSSLSGWQESNESWGNTQEWGLKQSEILRDSIHDLAEYDEEAAAIHSGRALHTNSQLLKFMTEEEANGRN